MVMDTSLPGPLMLDMLLPAMGMDTSLTGLLTRDMLLQAMDMVTSLPGPRMVDMLPAMDTNIRFLVDTRIL